MPNNKKYLVVLAGPTAVGKTAMAVKLANYYGTVILSADSRQFYRELNIGTAKPTWELTQAKHYFIDNKSITELYGAGHFEKDASALLDELFKEHEVVVLTGGSGLYINALLYGVDEFTEVPASLRATINGEFSSNGIGWLKEELKKSDPEYFNKVDENNPQRMIRALEVSRFTGKKYSDFLKGKRAKREFESIRILLNTDRKNLYERINSRVDDMIKKGLVEEVKSVKEYRYQNALKTVGYKEIFDHLDGKATLEEAADKIKQHTRNYAKRQLTWFRNRDSYKEFFDPDLKTLTTYIDAIIKNG